MNSTNLHATEKEVISEASGDRHDTASRRITVGFEVQQVAKAQKSHRNIWKAETARQAVEGYKS